MKTTILSEEELKELVHSTVLSALREYQPQPAQVEPPDLIPIELVIELTRLAKQTIYGHVFEKKFVLGTHYFKRGKKLLFSRKAILDWLMGKENN